MKNLAHTYNNATFIHELIFLILGVKTNFAAEIGLKALFCCFESVDIQRKEMKFCANTLVE